MFKLFAVVLFSLTLSIIFDNIKQNFLDKLQIKKIFIKNKIYKFLLLLFFTIFIKNIYNIVIAKKINNCLNNIINIQITKVAKKDIR